MKWESFWDKVGMNEGRVSNDQVTYLPLPRKQTRKNCGQHPRGPIEVFALTILTTAMTGMILHRSVHTVVYVLTTRLMGRPSQPT